MSKDNKLTELESIEAFLKFGKNLENTVIQSIDFRNADIHWKEYEINNTAFLGCAFKNKKQISKLLNKGAHIFPLFDDIPYNPYRSKLYTWQELMDGYEPENDQSLDKKIYDHFSDRKKPNLNIMEALSQRIHDHAIDDALDELLKDKFNKVIGIMGGHSALRTSEYYLKSAQIARELTRQGYFIVCGGGPGIMEAANFGAYFANYEEKEMLDALEIMKKSPHYTDREFVIASREVVEKYPDGAESLAVPTWFYGHEPSNLFASHIAKYFSNSIREDGLLAISIAGVIFAPGSAGTTQEIFMEATQNHYGSFGYYSPMVFLSSKRYQKETMIFPLLEQLAEGREYEKMITVADTPKETVDFILSHPPVKKGDV